MKRCPQCNRVESDNSLAFCRVDGTALVQDSLNEDSGTIRFNSAPVSGEAHTSVLPPAITDPGIRPVQQTIVLPSQSANETTRPLAKRKALPLIIALVVVIGFYLSNLGFMYTQTGSQNEALNVIKELEAKYSRREATGYHVAAVFVGLGDKDSAFSWLEKDFRNRTSTLVAWMDFPPFDSLRSDSRMVDLRKRMGLPQ